MNIEDILDCYSENITNYNDLKKLYERQTVMPFIGAGLSFKFYPLWGTCLLAMAEKYHIQARTNEHLEKGEFEEAATLVEQEYTPNAFYFELERVYNPSLLKNVTFQEPLILLPRLWNSGMITTNFDCVLEKVYQQCTDPFYRTVAPKNTSDIPGISGNLQQAKHILYKIHGCITDPRNLTFTESEYKSNYGDPINRDLPLPRALFQAAMGKTLLFMGCSLESDRTLNVLENLSDNMLRHFAIMELPKETHNPINPFKPNIYCGPDDQENAALRNKRKNLAEKNIYCIWYPHGQHEAITVLLKGLLPFSSIRPKYLIDNYDKNEVLRQISVNKQRILNELLLPWLPKQSPGFSFLFKDLFEYPDISMSKTKADINMVEFLENDYFDKNLAILGKAGAGKSTFLKYIYLYGSSSVRCIYVNARSLIGNKQNALEKFVNAIIYSNEACDERINLFIDGIDEAFANDVNGFNQLIEKAADKDRVTLWVGCRSDFFFRSINPYNTSLIYDYVTIKDWTPERAESYVSNYSNKIRDEKLLVKYQNITRDNPNITPFLANPFKLSLLLFLITEEDDINKLNLSNPFFLYDMFYTHWIRREQTRNIIGNKKPPALKSHYKIAQKLYIGQEAILKNTVTDSAITDLLITEQDNNGKIVIKGFYHQSLMEFVLAKMMLELFQRGGTELVEGLTHLYLKDVADFIKDGYKLKSKAELENIKTNLENIYRQICQMDNRILPQKAQSALDKLNEYELFTVKDQIIYFISRMPGIIAHEFLEYANNRESDCILKLDIAYGAALVGPIEIALNYAKKIYPNSWEDKTNRAWTLVFYGDVVANAYTYQDDGTADWNKARQARLRRLQSNDRKALRFRMFDLQLLYTFLVSRGWNDISCEELEIIRGCNIYADDLPEAIIKFLEKAKNELVSEYEKKL